MNPVAYFHIPDDLLLATDVVFPLWFAILLAGVKIRGYQDRLRDLWPFGAEPFLHYIDYAIKSSPPGSTDYAYCTGVTYFLKQQLVLYADMTPSTTPVEERKVILSDSASATLDRFIDACSALRIDQSCVASGRAYIRAMRALNAFQQSQYYKKGPYTKARIARSVLWMFGCVCDWGEVTVGELRQVSADQKQFLARFPPDMLVSDLAAQFGCPGELVSMYACLKVIS